MPLPLATILESLSALTMEDRCTRKNLRGSRRASPRPTAIACYNDELAFGALRAAMELGIEVPDQLSITGYDGIDLFKYAKPSLTTYRLDPVAIGKLLMDKLLEQLSSDDNLSGDIWQDGELIVGESAGWCAS